VIALARSELLRFRSRRLVKALAALALLAIVVTSAILFFRSHPTTAAEVQAAQRVAERSFHACADDEHLPKNAIPPNMTQREYCRSQARPESYLSDHAFHLVDARNFVEASAFLVAIVGWLVGGSFAGADWQAGTMVTLLTWEPRRVRVLLAKALALAVGVAVVTLAADLILEALLWLVATTRGSTIGAGASFARAMLLLDLRVMAVAVVASLLGFAIAMVARNTAAAIGIAFAYLTVIEGLMRALRPGWTPYLLGDNTNVFVLGQPIAGRSFAGSAVVLAAYGGVLLAVAAATFRARDIG
jgi:ABC-2 type transport system permease protein